MKTAKKIPAMLKIGKIILDGTPWVAVSVADTGSNAKIQASGADLVELRVDLFKDRSLEAVRKNVLLRSKLKLPLILTVRNDPREGAKPPFLSNAQKLQIFKGSIAAVDAVDIELSSRLFAVVKALARRHHKTMITSVHDFKETPSAARLETFRRTAHRRGAAILKVAVRANSAHDVRALLAFTLKHRRENLITISLGSKGSISRVTFPAAGSLLTIGCLDKPMAPGQLPVKQLKKALRAYYSSA